jgi:hypothetical protein
MKPSKRTEAIVVTFWDCGGGSCKVRHRTKAGAAKCPRRNWSGISQKERFERSAKRVRKALSLRESGKTYREIGQSLGTGAAYARDLVMRGRRRAGCKHKVTKPYRTSSIAENCRPGWKRCAYCSEIIPPSSVKADLSGTFYDQG